MRERVILSGNSFTTLLTQEAFIITYYESFQTLPMDFDNNDEELMRKVVSIMSDGRVKFVFLLKFLSLTSNEQTKQIYFLRALSHFCIRLLY